VDVGGHGLAVMTAGRRDSDGKNEALRNENHTREL
jgi:hypothetical protein